MHKYKVFDNYKTKAIKICKQKWKSFIEFKINYIDNEITVTLTCILTITSKNSYSTGLFPSAFDTGSSPAGGSFKDRG